MDRVKFVLNQNGLQIQDTLDQNALIMTSSGLVAQGSYQWVSWSVLGEGSLNDPFQSLWTLTSPFADDWSKAEGVEDAESIFLIKKIYGDIRPKLILNKKDPYLYSKLIATTKNTDGYDDQVHSFWKIKKAQAS